MLVPIGAIGSFVTVRDEFLPDETRRHLQLLEFIPNWHWAVWTSIVLAATIVIVLESAYFHYAKSGNLKDAKLRFRDAADKAETLLETGDATEESLLVIKYWQPGA